MISRRKLKERANEHTRNEGKAAWALIYGGSSIAQWAIIAGAIASGFIDKTAARTMRKVASKMTPHLKDRAWRKYKETGSIADALGEFF